MTKCKTYGDVIFAEQLQLNGCNGEDMYNHKSLHPGLRLRTQLIVGYHCSRVMILQVLAIELPCFVELGTRLFSTGHRGIRITLPRQCRCRISTTDPGLYSTPRFCTPVLPGFLTDWLYEYLFCALYLSILSSKPPLICQPVVFELPIAEYE